MCCAGVLGAQLCRGQLPVVYGQSQGRYVYLVQGLVVQAVVGRQLVPLCHGAPQGDPGRGQQALHAAAADEACAQACVQLQLQRQGQAALCHQVGLVALVALAGQGGLYGAARGVVVQGVQRGVLVFGPRQAVQPCALPVHGAAVGGLHDVAARVHQHGAVAHVQSVGITAQGGLLA